MPAGPLLRARQTTVVLKVLMPEIVREPRRLTRTRNDDARIVECGGQVHVHGHEPDRALRVEEYLEEVADSRVLVLRLSHIVDEVALVVREPAVRSRVFLCPELHELDVRQGIHDLLPALMRVHLQRPTKFSPQDDYPVRTFDQGRSIVLLFGKPDVGADRTLVECQSRLVLYG